MKLVIVESPTKAKTLEQFLGKGYKVTSSFGHVRDLPRGQLGIDEENNFEPRYVIPRAAQKKVTALKKTAKGENIDEVILATDEDREGEAIAWHLSYILDLDPAMAKRIVFHEITKEAIQSAIENPRKLNKDLVDAQQARRIIDRLVGYKLSPFLWKKIRGGLSAGRVQSVALKLVVEREEERRAFKPQEYWSIKIVLEVDGEKFESQIAKIDADKLDKLDIKNEKAAKEIVDDLSGKKVTVTDIKQKETKRNPSPPFITSTLQQQSSSRLGFSAKKTMVLAQKLYENGYITYMRTDSLNLSKQSTSAAASWLSKNFGKEYALLKSRAFRGKSKLAQEAHEAIRPTDPTKIPDSINVGKDEKRVYQLIWQRFMASQMPPAQFLTTKVTLSAVGDKHKYELGVNGNVMKFDGFLKVWPSKTEDKIIPELKESQEMDISEIAPEQHFTEPPARYNEASLIKALEENGIGRPSTYAPIISVIQNRGYVTKDEAKRFVPEETGEIVNKVLSEHFPKIVDTNFTAQIEEEFDEVANGLEEWRKVVSTFYKPFIENLNKKYEEVKKEDLVEEKVTDTKCDKCGKMMVEKIGRFGKFLACPGFPECKNTKNLKQEPDKIGMKCPDCKKGDIVTRKTRKGRLFYGCEKYPDCEYASWKDPREEDSSKKEEE
ncbi:MAG: type I DNA topoisomerase [Candidatus Colwellbacteria bacterium CG10_big_fil_rev_8_21_14_0_10_41_28]|uniref:DNA topoisomerase 1 n=1 Tax=Candidatus Colwellbacteria bacterium CG10_big_fil_rev_8_21_14_0_10_41_28 TaxID=1974539 RepID=A0A2H0VGX6_9BACT|nr:MAG: type I DNA topoisomerase [Candidatus Colwellbacteria bacterium CG10_big_fil_rev_8_21_14_0_10_41_28]